MTDRRRRVPQPAPRRRANPVALAIVAAGTVLVVVSFTALDWYRIAGQGTTFANLRTDLDSPGAPLLPKIYFSWLGWALLAITVLAAVAALLPIGTPGRVLRVLAPVFGVVALLITLLALNTLWTELRRVSDEAAGLGVFKYSTIGLYLALIGFAVAGIGGALGPRPAGAA